MDPCLLCRGIFCFLGVLSHHFDSPFTEWSIGENSYAVCFFSLFLLCSSGSLKVHLEGDKLILLWEWYVHNCFQSNLNHLLLFFCEACSITEIAYFIQDTISKGMDECDICHHKYGVCIKVKGFFFKILLVLCKCIMSLSLNVNY